MDYVLSLLPTFFFFFSDLMFKVAALTFKLIHKIVDFGKQNPSEKYVLCAQHGSEVAAIFSLFMYVKKAIERAPTMRQHVFTSVQKSSAGAEISKTSQFL